MRFLRLVSTALAFLVVFVATLDAAEPAKDLEKFDPANFARPTVIDNEWFPLKPGMRYVWDGSSVDEEGDEESRSIVSVVTDWTKEIAGVRTVVVWDRDYVDGELEESEIMFLAQDKEGAVWLLGEYPEEYDNGEFDKSPCWIHGAGDGHAGILIKKEPKLGAPSYSQGWAPSVEFTDRAEVYQVGQKVTVPAGNYDDVVVIDEFDRESPGAHHLKFYARGVGVVHIGWRGEKTDQELLDLIKVEQLSAEEMAEARAEALKLDKHAYETSKGVYGKTKPIEPGSGSAGAK